MLIELAIDLRESGVQLRGTFAGNDIARCSCVLGDRLIQRSVQGFLSGMDADKPFSQLFQMNNVGISRYPRRTI